jgi:hypothetical protein
MDCSVWMYVCTGHAAGIPETSPPSSILRWSFGLQLSLWPVRMLTNLADLTKCPVLKDSSYSSKRPSPHITSSTQ